jgi:hypothetical protein
MIFRARMMKTGHSVERILRRGTGKRKYRSDDHLSLPFFIHYETSLEKHTAEKK